MSPQAVSPKDALTLYPALGSTGTLANLRLAKKGPKFYKVGRKVVYRVDDLEAFLFARPVQTHDSVEAAR